MTLEHLVILIARAQTFRSLAVIRWPYKVSSRIFGFGDGFLCTDVINMGEFGVAVIPY